MTYAVNSINKSQQPLTGLSDSQLQNLQLQNIDTDKINRGINNSPVVKVADQKNPWLTAGVFLPTWLAVYLGMNKFSQISRGNYEDSAFAKMDKLDEKISKSKIIDNDIVKGIRKGFKSTKTFFNEKIVERSAILRSMLRTPSVPENKMIHTMAGGIKTEIASSAVQLLDKYTNNGTILERVKELGFVNNAGVADVEAYKEVVKNSHKYVDKVMDICNKQGQKQAYEIERGGKIPWSRHFTADKQPKYLSEMLPFTQRLFKKKVYFSEYANKLKAVEKPGVSKFVLKVIEGLTNAGSGAVGGGAIVSLMGAWFIGDAIIRTIKAPSGNGEKRKTFAENMIYNLGFYMTMPLAVKVMHSVGGLQYIGMTKEQVEAYRTKLEEFNKMAKEGKFDKASYKEARKELVNMLKGDTRVLKADGFGGKNIAKVAKNFIYLPLKKLSSMFMVGLETLHPLRANGQANFGQKVFKEGGYWTKQGLAYPVRLIAFMFVLAPFLAKFFARGSHLVFGKPTKSVLDEGKEESSQATKNEIAHAAPTAIKTIRRDQPLEAQSTMTPIQNSSAPRQNLLDMHKSQNQASANIVSAPIAPATIPAPAYTPTYAPAPAANMNTIAKPQEPTRTYTYVPSDEAVKVNPKNNEQYPPQVQSALAKANKAEKIAGKFTH